MTPVSGSESQIIESVRSECGSNNWRLGELAAQWTERWAKGRTDAAFVELVGDGYGLSVDRVGRCRRVWIDFGELQLDQDVSLRQKFFELSWSHFDKARQFPEEFQTEALGWAIDNEASIQEMLAIMKLTHGQSIPETVPTREEIQQASIESRPPVKSTASKSARQSPIKQSVGLAVVEQFGSDHVASRAAPREDLPDSRDLPKVPRDSETAPPYDKYKSLAKNSVKTLSLLSQSIDPEWGHLTNSQQDEILDAMESLTRTLDLTGQRLARRVHKRLFAITQLMAKEWAVLAESELLHLADPIEDLHHGCMLRLRSTDTPKPASAKKPK